MDKVAMDGNRFFFSQLSSTNKSKDIALFTLGLEKNDEEDRETLRTLFVNEVTDKITYCKV